MGLQVKSSDDFRLNYERIAGSPEFKQLIAAKKRFTIGTTLFFLFFSLLLPILAFYTDVLTIQIAGSITWGWIFAFSQFAMTWSVCHLYVKKAGEFDDMAKRVLETEIKRSKVKNGY
ncbi:DUF485 domain-containing protein [Metabacillus sp. KIGAM252]|uniref:DUF485 domain-containing protein n=1 Tax=Metabacillus flavus TaxID=2823519 RepID=A0ABS5LCL2_9BACI|nr:DUF485 domain-containing protein [Metabacillus flavus]MBS2968452.1 DUF485 domain-containing protein [Metabacillus flavus]